jgi:hypothetical protein
VRQVATLARLVGGHAMLGGADAAALDRFEGDGGAGVEMSENASRKQVRATLQL